MKDLLAEIGELAERNDELENAREESARALELADEMGKEWKRKYEIAKTELRGVKGRRQALAFLELDEIY